MENDCFRLDRNIVIYYWIGFVFRYIRDNYRYREQKAEKYISIFGLIKGEWENINALERLKIIESKETQTMNVLSISRTATNKVYRLFIVLPNKKIELMSGKRDTIIKRAEYISSTLQTTIINNTK